MSKQVKPKKTDAVKEEETTEDKAEVMPVKFDFKSWAEESQLTEKAVQILREQDLNVVEALSMLEETDIKELNLTVGQQKLLAKGINRAQPLVPKPQGEPEEPIKEIKTTTLAKDKDLESILNKLESSGGLEALLTGAPLANSGGNTSNSSKVLRVDNDPHVYLNRLTKGPTGNSKTLGMSKPMLIPDFVDYGAGHYDEQEIASSSSTSVFVRSLKGKPKLESVTVSNWIAANAKIMDQLIVSGQLKSQSDISDYLAYTVKIEELVEAFTWPSVIQYDNEYRKRQFQYGNRWGSDSQHLHSRFFKQRGLVGSQNRGYQAGVKPKSPRNPSTKAVQICNSYNSTTGYSWPNCRFLHKCNIDGCTITPAHPQHEHEKLISKGKN